MHSLSLAFFCGDWTILSPWNYAGEQKLDDKKWQSIVIFLRQLAALNSDVDAVINYLVKEVPNLVPSDGLAIELADGSDLVYRAGSGIAERQLGMRVPLADSLAGLAVAHKRIFVSHDSETDSRVNREACRLVGLRSMAVIPLSTNGENVGALKVMQKLPEGFAADDVQVLELISPSIDIALETARRWTAQVAQTDRFFELATHDTLTGLENRSRFYDRLRQHLKVASRNSSPFAIVMMDLDGLKEVNDQHGHLAGDYLLRTFAARLKKRIRESDLLARLGGDEFGMILPEQVDFTHSHSTVERMMEEVEGVLQFEAVLFPLLVSFGVTIATSSNGPLEKLVDEADQQLYVHKRRRKQASRGAQQSR